MQCGRSSQVGKKGGRIQVGGSRHERRCQRAVGDMTWARFLEEAGGRGSQVYNPTELAFRHANDFGNVLGWDGTLEGDACQYLEFT